jgi:hypothetical protein
VWAKYLFVDPVRDVAVLGTPDEQELEAEAEAYDALVARVTPFKVADLTASQVDG